jgi:hypothetical protein
MVTVEGRFLLQRIAIEDPDILLWDYGMCHCGKLDKHRLDCSFFVKSLISKRRFQDFRLPESHPEQEGVPYTGLSSITDLLFHHFRPRIRNDISEFGQ